MTFDGNCPTVPNPQNGTAGHPAKSGTPCGTARGTVSLKSLAGAVLRRKRAGHPAGHPAGQAVPRTPPESISEWDTSDNGATVPLSQAVSQGGGTGLSHMGVRFPDTVPLSHGAGLGQVGHPESPSDFYRRACPGYPRECLAPCRDADLGSLSFCKRFRWAQQAENA